jgi:hypothetical protein
MHRLCDPTCRWLWKRRSRHGRRGVLPPMFKGSESPSHFLGLRVVRTTRSRDRVRHRPAGAGAGPQRAARPLGHLSSIGPGLLGQLRRTPPPLLGWLSGLCCLGAAGPAYASKDGPVAGSRWRPAIPAPSAGLTPRSVQASRTTRGRSQRDACSRESQVRRWEVEPTFKGVWYAALNFGPLPLRDTRLDQCP